MFPNARNLAATVAVAALLTTPLHAQEARPAADAEPATGAPEATAAARLPADSMELGEKYIDWILDYRADSLWARFGPEMRETFGSVGDFLDGMAEIHGRVGEQKQVISRRFWMRNGKPQYWHTATFDKIGEPVVFRVVIEPDGTISGLGFNPESQNPPVDDPDQHADEGP